MTLETHNNKGTSHPNYNITREDLERINKLALECKIQPITDKSGKSYYKLPYPNKALKDAMKLWNERESKLCEILKLKG